MNMRGLRLALVLRLAGCVPQLFIGPERLTAQDSEQRVEAILSRMTLEEKIDLIGGVPNMYTQSFPRLGIPTLKMSDGPLGVHDYGPTTAYPAGIALAASWDIALASRVGVMLVNFNV
ncbi:MAG TPA: hypothetical protein VLY23_03085 [Candidatus Acidoferrum sp.]|nr:hypothetical protein [Candidatus Acidoferrum sp.]